MIGAAVGGCGVNVHSASIRGTAYVRLDDAVKKHPLYPQLTQFDDAIAAIIASIQRSARAAGRQRHRRADGRAQS